MCQRPRVIKRAYKRGRPSPSKGHGGVRSRCRIGILGAERAGGGHDVRPAILLLGETRQRVAADWLWPENKKKVQSSPVSINRIAVTHFVAVEGIPISLLSCSYRAASAFMGLTVPAPATALDGALSMASARSVDFAGVAEMISLGS